MNYKKYIFAFIIVLLSGCSSMYKKPDPCTCDPNEEMKDFIVV